jgi:predicted O-methyltransferase YrrM
MKKAGFVLSIVVTLVLTAANAMAQPPAAPGGPRRGPGGPGPASRLMDVLDVNHDGELSAEEMAGAAQALRKADKNGNGKLDRDELRPPRPQGGAAYGQPDLSHGTANFDTPPLAKDATEKKILAILDDLAHHRTPGGANVPPGDGRILRVLTAAVGAKQVVEVGTSTGISGVWFCLALRETGGKLTTLEIDPGRAAIARQNFQKAGVTDLVTLIEGDAHEAVKHLPGPIDLVFLDADKVGYVDYLEKLLPKVRPGGLIVAHNMTVQHADPRYVKAITSNPNLETVFLNLDASGIGVTLKKR